MTDQVTAAREMAISPRIESLLSSRLFLAPQIVGNRIYFISNISGAFSLYVMDEGGSIPEPLLPPHIALQNPELMGGHSFYVFPKLNRIVVMIDHDGDENYQPLLIPIDGGFPQTAFDNQLAAYRCHLGDCDPETNTFTLGAESRQEALIVAFEGNLETNELVKLAEGKWLGMSDLSEDRSRGVLIDSYTFGDSVLYLWERGREGRTLLYGTPLEERTEEEREQINGIHSIHFTPDARGLLFVTSLFDDAFGLGYLDIDHPEEVKPVRVTGTRHSGTGEMDGLNLMKDNRFYVQYNIDGVSWVYEGTFDEEALEMRLDRALVGEGALANGTVEGIFYDKSSDRFALAFSTATSPTQIYTLEDADRKPVAHTRERILGVPAHLMAPGEDASFTSFDGLRISARLYLPARETGAEPPYPLVYYIHGGPQSQERPNYAWFSMPLIQFLTLNGFAVFVPNVRGSTGYGMDYMKRVDHDWGGKDRLDHVHAMTEVLPRDSRLDTRRTAVMGRSYGGYMTLTLVSRHPDLWAAGCDMFGPYDLIPFIDRLPETWKPYFAIAVGDPETERDLLEERSPSTYFDDVSCPLLVIQGRNDPRVTEQESRDVVERLRNEGKEVDLIVFENEGHDVIKFENKVRCYNAITDYFTKYLKPA